jgi:MoaA/NifB/PqqE/SkfB family radical SAM enzyme
MATVPINNLQFSLETPEREAAYETNRGFGCEEDYRKNREQWSDFPKRQFVNDYPLHVDLELASICNMRCPFCYTITPEFRERVNAKLMDYDLFTRLIDQCAAGGVYSIRLSYRGETFLHPRVADCVRYAKQAGIKEVSSLTNAEKLDEQLFTEIMEAGIDWLTISIDGVGETYENIRRPAKFDRLVEKLTNFKQIKDDAGSVKPVIKIQSVLPAIENDPDTYYNIFAPITDLIYANPLIDFMEDTSRFPKIPDFSCPQIFQRLVVGADGRCVMCIPDENGDNILGDANIQTIHEIWHGAEITRVRKLHITGQACDTIGPCKVCTLPRERVDENIEVDGRTVIAAKYSGGTEKISDLKTPDRWKRKGLSS